MANWGLTEDMRASKPWGIPGAVLEPAKVITDPIHGDVYLNRLEQAIVDSPPFQRLRRVRQLGTTHLVYPGATHTRFAHALGALRVAQDLLDVALNQGETRHGRPDLFREWREDLGVAVGGRPSKDPSARTRYIRRVAEAIVVARLGALLHDISHVAFGHTVEDDLLVLQPHDENIPRFNRLWRRIREQRFRTNDGAQYTVGDVISERLFRQFRPLVLSKAKGRVPQKRMRFPFVEDLVGNTICADLIDYLQRDHAFTGLPISLGQRYMTGFYVTPSDKRELFPARMALNIERGNQERVDVVTELLKHLRYRYELQERVIVHHAKLAADAMVGKMLELVRDLLWAGSATAWLDPPFEEEEFAPARVAEDDVDELRKQIRAEDQEVEKGINDWVEGRLEELFLSLGDDGLLEHFRDSNKDATSGRRQAIHVLADDLLERRLFKRAAKVKGAKAAKELYDKYKSPEARRTLEQDAARFAELDGGWQVVLWLPNPDMRLKQAEVLVRHANGVSRLVDYSPRGREIYEEHKALWSVWVFVHPEVTEEEQTWVLARLAETMLISWEGYDRQLGADPTSATAHMAAFDELGGNELEDEVQDLMEYAAQRPLRGSADRVGVLKAHYKLLNESRPPRNP
jgi:HD superfamily phosphohydrolase